MAFVICDTGPYRQLNPGADMMRKDRDVRTFVWVDSWQQQCCGEPFEIGTRVTWSVLPNVGRDEWVAHMLGDEWGDAVRFHEEHHDETETTLTGTVVAINVVMSHRELGRSGGVEAWIPKAAGGSLTSTQTADPWEPEKALSESDDATFDGWIVELEGAFLSSSD